MTITSEEARAREVLQREIEAEGADFARAHSVRREATAGFTVRLEGVAIRAMLTFAHQSPSRAAGGVDYRAEFEAALIARDEAGYLGTSPAETIRALSEELRATPAELPALPSREVPHWASPQGAVIEARKVLQGARTHLLDQQRQNSHIKGLYGSALAALEPAFGALDTLEQLALSQDRGAGAEA